MTATSLARTRRIILSLGLLAAACLAPINASAADDHVQQDAPAAPPGLVSVPAEGRIALRLGSGLSVRAHQSMDLYTTDNTLRARNLGLGVDVWRFRKLLAVAIEGDYSSEQASSTGVLGGDFNSYYKLYQGNLGASVRYNLGGIHPLLALVSPHLRVFGSVAWTNQRLLDRSRALEYATGYQATGGAGIAAGLSVRSPSLLPIRGSSLLALSLGLRVEAGYGFMGDPEFRLDPVDNGAHPIPVNGASLGHLQLDAAFLRATLELRI